MSPIDVLTAEFISRKTDLIEYEPLFRYLVSAYRSGYSFVELSDTTLIPSVAIDSELVSLHDQIVAAFSKAISEGLTSDYFVIEDSKLYLRRSYNTKKRIQCELERLKGAVAKVHVDLQVAKRAVSETPSLNIQQAEAILYALESSVATISGGPGTGKTYTAGHLLKIFLESSSGNARVGLSAPTGKAVATLSKSIEKALNSQFDAKTLHALLKIRPLGKDSNDPDFLPLDILIVDECSMIDERLFERLLSRLATGTRLILLGDPDQLPPIEPGAPFVELVQAQKCGHLEVCQRAELQSLVQFATYIRTRSTIQALEFAKQGQGIDLQILDENEMYAALQRELATFTCHDMSSYTKRRLLTPIRTGRFGVEEINQAIYQKQAPGAAMPIMILKNDYELDLANGQIGILEGARVSFETSNAPRVIPKVLLGPYEPAFCLSVHKSQGSEFDEVFLLLPSGSERFGRKMLYTAVTRTKKKLHIWTSEEVFRSCIEN